VQLRTDFPFRERRVTTSQQSKKRVLVPLHLETTVITTSCIMSRTDAAKNWQPSASDQKLIDRMMDYLIVAERCLMELRTLDASYVQPLWLQLQSVFQADRVKYPSAMAAQNDMRGRRDFLAKCQAICFPPPSRASRSPQE
jgi:hypothetical protein